MKKEQTSKSVFTSSLKLSGKQFVIDRRPAVVKKALEFLAKAPADTIYTSEELAEKLGCPRAAVQDEGRFLSEYAMAISGVGRRYKVYGSKKAIETLKRELAGAR